MPIADGDNTSEYTWINNVVPTTYAVGDRINVADGETVRFGLNDQETAYVRLLSDLATAPTISAGAGQLLDADGNPLATFPTDAGEYMLIQDGINTRVYPRCCDTGGGTGTPSTFDLTTLITN